MTAVSMQCLPCGQEEEKTFQTHTKNKKDEGERGYCTTEHFFTVLPFSIPFSKRLNKRSESICTEQQFKSLSGE